MNAKTYWLRRVAKYYGLPVEVLKTAIRLTTQIKVPENVPDEVWEGAQATIRKIAPVAEIIVRRWDLAKRRNANPELDYQDKILEYLEEENTKPIPAVLPNPNRSIPEPRREPKPKPEPEHESQYWLDD